MGTIAIITARGGSKRIPGKNIREFCGKPVIAYSIQAALESGMFEEVMVSTDSREIAGIAKQYGASVPFLRSETASNDFAASADVIKEVLKKYKEKGRTFEHFACIYPTAPFLTAQKLKEAMGMLKESGAEALVPVVKYSFPPQRAFVIRDGLVRYQYPRYEKVRSQDLEPVYHDCGQFYLCSSSGLLRNHSFIQPDTIPFMIPEEEVQDIDTLSDWAVAEAKYAALHKTL